MRKKKRLKRLLKAMREGRAGIKGGILGGKISASKTAEIKGLTVSWGVKAFWHPINSITIDGRILDEKGRFVDRKKKVPVVTISGYNQDGEIIEEKLFPSKNMVRVVRAVLSKEKI